MSKITAPGAWTKVTFGEVVTQIKDRVHDVNDCGLLEYVRGEHFEPGNLRLIGRSALGDGKHGSAFCMRFQSGDVLYVSRNPQLRKAAVADFEGICANTTYVCRANEEYLLQELLPFIMQTESFVEYTIRHKRGSTNFYLNWSDIAGYEISLPPLEEQRRIVEVLQASETTLTSLDLLSVKLDQARFAHLNHFFISRISGGLPLPEVASIASGGTPSKSASELWGGELPWASGKDLKVRSLETTKLKLTKEGWAVAKTAPADSTLIVVRGMILAHTFPVTVCAVPMAFNQDLRALIAKDGLMPEYLTLWAEWAGPWFLNRTSESSHGTKRLDSRVFDDALVPRPSIEVQEDLIRAQEFFLKQKRQSEQRMSQARTCKASLLREIFEVYP